MRCGFSLSGPGGPRQLAPVLVMTALLVLSGCQQEPIEHYQVAREPAVKREVRLLGGMVFKDKWDWFFKVVGPPESMAKQAEPFRTFLTSLKFADASGEKVTWTLPEGWEEKPGNQVRYATLALPGGLNVTVFRFPHPAGSVLENVNRWRKQDVGLADLTQAELDDDKNLQKLPLDKGEVLLVDSTGPGPKKGARPMMGGAN